MKPVFRHSQLYTFLLVCHHESLEKKILDCGAGGDTPPLAIFKEHGFETFGIDISDEQIKRTKEFEEKHQMTLNIEKGNMLSIPFPDESFGCVYSYNSIFHMSKEDIRKSIQEIRRVLKTGGMAFINFASINDDRATVGKKVGDGEYLQDEHMGKDILHSYFDENEAEDYFDGFRIFYKENRIKNIFRDDMKITRGYIDYIIVKE